MNTPYWLKPSELRSRTLLTQKTYHLSSGNMAKSNATVVTVSVEFKLHELEMNRSLIIRNR